MIILAIDPSPDKSAWVQYHVSGKIIAHGKDTADDMFANILPVLSFNIIACEMVACYGMAVGASVFETARMVGRFEQWLLESNKIKPKTFSSWAAKEFHTVYRKDVKMHLCQSMRAKDGNIRQALIDRFGPQGTKKNPGPTYGISADRWAALGVAVTFADNLK